MAKEGTRTCIRLGPIPRNFLFSLQVTLGFLRARLVDDENVGIQGWASCGRLLWPPFGAREARSAAGPRRELYPPAAIGECQT